MESERLTEHHFISLIAGRISGLVVDVVLFLKDT